MPAIGQLPEMPRSLFTEARVAAGAEQSKVRCVGCHLYPEPSLLDRDTWQKHVLPWMMMINGLAPELLPAGREGELIKSTGTVLLTPAMSRDEWWSIVAYYLKMAPTTLPPSTNGHLKISNSLPGFVPRSLPVGASESMASLVQIDSKRHRLFVGDGQRRTLDVFSAGGEPLTSLPLGTVPVSLWNGKEGLYITGMGRFSPSQMPSGGLFLCAGPPAGTNWSLPRAILNGLTRPVCATYADMNGDGKTDIILSMFGWYGGRLSLFENKGNGEYTEHVLHPKPGALQTEVRDLDGDGRPDVAALFAQATEGLLFFYNRGGGDFEAKTIFQKHPSFGHTYFEMVDIDGDGTLDLLVTNGDNGDYESAPKPYHGLRIYLGRGGGVFEEKLFLPLHGAYKAVARDFDGDGDLDIAAISYYPDYRSAPEESFVFLENKGKLEFSASTFSNCTAGRWMTLDAGDLDGDGDMDIVLGAARKGPGRSAYVPPNLDKAWRESGVSVMILENTRAGKPKR